MHSGNIIAVNRLAELGIAFECLDEDIRAPETAIKLSVVNSGVLLTHRSNMVSQADYVLAMKGGQISDLERPNKMLNAANSELDVYDKGDDETINNVEKKGLL